jgi:hypothetical protein
MKKNINNYCGNITNNINFKISTLILNSKINKTFGKLLKLCIKYEIQLFNNDNNTYNIRDNNDILFDVIDLKKKSINKYSNDILICMNNEKYIDDLDNLHYELKKTLKEIDILKYLLRDIYNDIELKKMLYENNILDEDKKSDDSNEKKKYKKCDKFIAEYIC